MGAHFTPQSIAVSDLNRQYNGRLLNVTTLICFCGVKGHAKVSESVSKPFLTALKPLFWLACKGQFTPKVFLTS